MRGVWSWRLLFVGLAGAITFFALLPFGPADAQVPGPELTLCLAAAWVLRRPDYVPPAIVVPVVLMQDMLLMRPIGLWTLIVLLATEWLRRRVDQMEALPFWTEAGTACLVILAAFVAEYATLALLFAERPPLLGQTIHALATMVFYVPAALFSMLLGVRRLKPGELDSLGAHT